MEIRKKKEAELQGRKCSDEIENYSRQRTAQKMGQKKERKERDERKKKGTKASIRRHDKTRKDECKNIDKTGR